MDKQHLMRAATLLGEYLRDKAALDNFEKGGKIISMQITGNLPSPREGVPPPAVAISTQQMGSPQMVDLIKQELEARVAEIAQELDDLGVTGLDDKPVAANESTRAKGKRRK